MCFISLIDLLMWSQASESLTNTAVTLGADVIISCDLDIEEIYWYKQKSPDPPEFILRTFDSTYEGAQYENSNFTHKYSVKTNSRLFIRNITADELGVYYCVKTSEPQKFSNGTKIYINGESFSHFRCIYIPYYGFPCWIHYTVCVYKVVNVWNRDWQNLKHFTDSVHRNQTESQEIEWRNLTIITSVLMNVLSIIALIGLYCFYYRYVQVSLN